MFSVSFYDATCRLSFKAYMGIGKEDIRKKDTQALQRVGTIFCAIFIRAGMHGHGSWSRTVLEQVLHSIGIVTGQYWNRYQNVRMKIGTAKYGNSTQYWNRWCKVWNM